MLSGSAAQFTGTNGPPARGELSWIARASSSLPVPDSPSRSTVACDGAACMHDLHRPPPGQRLADQRPPLLGGELGAQRAVLLHQRPLLQRLADDAHQVRALDRLGHEIVGALLHRLDRVLDGAVGGHQDRLGLGRDALARAQQVHPRHPRHHQVGQQHRDRLAADDVQRLAARARGQHAQRFALQDLLQRIDDRGLVVHDQDRRGALAGGVTSIPPGLQQRCQARRWNRASH